MKILQISTYDVRGGAARATYRLHRGLREMGQSNHTLVRYKETDDASISGVTIKQAMDPNSFFLNVPIQEHYISAHRTDISNTLFSLPYPGYDLSGVPLVQNADVINLHWVAQFQSPVTLKNIFASGKPVVWTLHDQWAFTGGCHYSGGCEGYRKACQKCPQLSKDPFSLPETMLSDKETLFKNANLTIVTPSRWMGRCAGESRLFKSLRVEVIPNSLETDLYFPIPKDRAKKRLNIRHDAVTLLFGAIDGAEKRKGFFELVDAMRFCLENDFFQDLLGKDQLRLICFGSPNEKLESMGIPFVSLGKLGTDEEIRDAYSAADIFLLPSLEDNLPNTVLESMSCGTPVVAFDVGGVSDMITDGINGHLVEAFDIRQMSETIVYLAVDSDKRAAMGKAGHERVLTDYALNFQAKHYLDLYEDLLPHKKRSKPDEKDKPEFARGMEGNSEISMSASQVSLSTDLGPRFSAIYDPMLFETLKAYTPDIYAQLNTSEMDRHKRLSQVDRLTDLLESCEADRAARLEQLKICEADRAARLEQLKICEADRAARLDVINDLTAKLKAKKIGKQLEECLSLAEGLKQELDRETRRASAAEQGWRALENTGVVRKARKVGFIKSDMPNSLKNGADEK